MEQLLNLVWLVAMAGIVLGVAMRPHSRLHHTPRYVALVIFACIAVLLFPVISATDDLHPGSDLSDDAAWRHSKRIFGALALMVFLLVAVVPALVREATWFFARERTVAASPFGFARLDLGRAPPFLA